MNKNKAFSLLAMHSMAMSIMGDNTMHGSNIKTSISDIDFTPKKAPIPKGAKEYFFAEDGRMFHADNIATCYSCISINEKSARKKFSKWLEQNKQTIKTKDNENQIKS